MEILGNWHPKLRKKDPDSGPERIIKAGIDSKFTDKRI